MNIQEIDISSPEFFWEIRLPDFDISGEQGEGEALHEGMLLSGAFRLLVAALYEFEVTNHRVWQISQRRSEDLLKKRVPASVQDWNRSVFDNTGLPDTIWSATRKLRDQSFTYALHQVLVNFRRFEKYFDTPGIEDLLNDFEHAHPGLKDVRDSLAHYDDRMRREGRVNFKKTKIEAPLLYVASSGGVSVTNSEGKVSSIRVGREEVAHARGLLISAFKLAGFRSFGDENYW